MLQIIHADWSRACHVTKRCSLNGYWPDRRPLLLRTKLCIETAVETFGKNVFNLQKAWPREPPFSQESVKSISKSEGILDLAMITIKKVDGFSRGFCLVDNYSDDGVATNETMKNRQ